MSSTFSERLVERVAERRSQLVLGLDPDPSHLWPAAVQHAAAATSEPGSSARERAADAVAAHCALAIEAVAEECVGVKFQLACFERLGAAGGAVLERLVKLAREAGLLTIADAKRGDIDVSARAYAQALLGSTPSPFGPLPGLGADAVTVNPLLGMDSLTPFAEVARSAGAGLFVLVRTSNPGARDVQDLRLGAGETVSDRLAALVASLDPGGGPLSDVGAVVGATAPQHLDRLRAVMPRVVMLLPGVGAQGAQVSRLAAAFQPGPAGGLITVSRGIIAAGERTGQDPASSAREVARGLREEVWALSRS